ncbi:hypothetical protein E0W68_07655 [Flavobacterium salilacus subsp. salilacus]|uniref:hypothetical protein n=1 Tax=Flavobacterium TaxID=237 RepID=UPI00107583F6|nr:MULTISPECIES: hypothetical protein [Flavobacterium]KAF2518626.1 hypothetical protein E0W68_07655 [Flavobacterium salilacus subsp. salilacus]MBE1613583.1 hypothetical protein [Flavobacterium sp. SaA2.13]
MRYILILLFLFTLSAKSQVMHCGYDFTSYIVLDVHESGKTENIKNLKITVVDSLGRDVINVNNAYSFKNANAPLQFTSNYKIGDDNKRLTEGTTAKKERWFFPFAKDNYLLSVANTFPADRFSIKVEDIDGAENGGTFKSVIVPLYSYNMYVLCSNESQQAAVKFGRKMNRPIDVVLEKKAP